MEQKGEIAISLIIPVYNVSAYIERCLTSVIKQTYNHFECILVDDASPDDSIAKCERMIAEYEGPIRFRILHHQRNRGLSAARNTGTDAATGDYILYIDSDDLISNDCVERLVAPVLKDGSIEVVVGEHLRFSDSGLLSNQKNSWRRKEDLATHEAVRGLYFDRKRHLPPAAWNKLTSKRFIDQHHLRFEEGQIWEDTLWTFFEMKHLCHIYVIPDATYYYYNRPDSISNGIAKDELARQWCNVYDLISRNFTPGDEAREAALHLNRFSRISIGLPMTRQLRATARRFACALSFGEYPVEKMLLWVVGIMPHNRTGREIFTSLSKRLAKR